MAATKNVSSKLIAYNHYVSVTKQQMKQENNVIFSKWLIKGFEGFCFGSDSKLYKLAYESNKRYMALREIKKQEPNRYKLNGIWRSEKQLEGITYLNPNPEIIIKCEEMPF